MGDKFSISRRRLLQAGAALGGAMLLPGVMQAAWAGGSDNRSKPACGSDLFR